MHWARPGSKNSNTHMVKHGRRGPAITSAATACVEEVPTYAAIARGDKKWWPALGGKGGAEDRSTPRAWPVPFPPSPSPSPSPGQPVLSTPPRGVAQHQRRPQWYDLTLGEDLDDDEGDLEGKFLPSVPSFPSWGTTAAIYEADWAHCSVRPIGQWWHECLLPVPALHPASSAPGGWWEALLPPPAAEAHCVMDGGDDVADVVGPPVTPPPVAPPAELVPLWRGAQSRRAEQPAPERDPPCAAVAVTAERELDPLWQGLMTFTDDQLEAVRATHGLGECGSRHARIVELYGVFSKVRDLVSAAVRFPSDHG